MDVARLRGGLGVGAALVVAALVAVPPTVVLAGVLAALAAVLAGREPETVGTLAVASLALSAAVAVAAAGVTGAPNPSAALAALAVTVGIAGCLAGLVGTVRPGPLLGAWTALSLLPVAVVAVPAASAQPAGSLLGARVAILGAGLVLVSLPGVVIAAAGWAALSSWREAALPPWLLTAGPPALFAASVVVFLPASPNVGALLEGGAGDGPLAYTMLWSVALVVVASALAGAVAAENERFRRGPAWAGVACGPLALGVAVVIGGGDIFAGATLATIPPAAEAFGAVSETTTPGTARTLAAFVGIAGAGAAVTLPTRVPGLRRVIAGRPAAVGSGALLAAIILTDLGTATTALAGALAVLSWLLVRDPADSEPPPRTVLARTGVVTLAVATGAVLAVSMVGAVPRTEPGFGAVLLLSGVAVLGVAIAR